MPILSLMLPSKMITILILALVSNSIWATPIPKIDGDFANQLFALEKKHDKRIEENVMEMVQNRNENPEMLGQQVTLIEMTFTEILLTFIFTGWTFGERNERGLGPKLCKSYGDL